MRVKPQIVLPIANTVVTRLSSFVRQVDFALDWLFFESGRAVYRQVKNYFCKQIKIDNIEFLIKSFYSALIYGLYNYQKLFYSFIHHSVI